MVTFVSGIGYRFGHELVLGECCVYIPPLRAKSFVLLKILGWSTCRFSLLTLVVPCLFLRKEFLGDTDSISLGESVAGVSVLVFPRLRLNCCVVGRIVLLLLVCV